MADAGTLRPWIQAQHLDDEALKTYRKRFETHPARMTVLEDFLVPAMADKLSRFLSDEATFEPEFGLFSGPDGAVPEEVWAAAPEDDRFFRYGRNVGIPPEHRFSPNALTYLRFRKTFQTDACKGFFEEITGLELGASDDFGSHRMAVGDYMRAHDDDNNDRRVAIVIYLTPGWEPRFGGTLHVRDAAGEVHDVEARYNSAVVFDTQADTVHYVDPVTEEAGELARLTIGGWYHNPS